MMLAVMLALQLAQVPQAASPAQSPPACQQEPEVLKPQIPRDFDMQEVDHTLSATIAVVLAADGTVRKASVYNSSGDLSFDSASVAAARSSKYRPKVVDCTPVGSTYYFKTSVTPN